MSNLATYQHSGEHIIALLERTDPHRTVTARQIIRKNLLVVEQYVTEPERIVKSFTPKEKGAVYMPRKKERSAKCPSVKECIGGLCMFGIFAVLLFVCAAFQGPRSWESQSTTIQASEKWQG